MPPSRTERVQGTRDVMKGYMGALDVFSAVQQSTAAEVSNALSYYSSGHYENYDKL